MLAIADALFILYSNTVGDGPIFKGIEIGEEEHEFAIKSGSLLMILGNITYNTQEKTFRIDSPLL